jgi:secreted PhoX family phosphatase
MEPSALPATEPEGAFSGRFSGTRRNFIRGVAAAGASTAIASTLGRSGTLDLFSATADAAEPTAFSNFRAIAPSSADAFEVPDGFRADIVIGYGDKFADDKGNEYTYGYNNDYLAFFPLGDGSTEGILFVNHEYTNAFYLHGYKANDPGGKSRAEIDLERSTIGNSILHIRRNAEGIWKPVSPSKYNKRIYAGLMPGQPGFEYSEFRVTGPLADDPKVGPENHGSLGNCSGGTTPWGTAISCEENFDGYGQRIPSPQDFNMGWADPTNDGFPGYPEYHPDAPYRSDRPGLRKYGWVCEHDPYDPGFVPRKHTALGRFRHENTAFRHVPGRKFVIYMGDDGSNDCVYKFVSDREFRPGDRAHNLQILEAGTLYVARWYPEGRRRFENVGDVQPITQESGTGEWVEIPVAGLSDTRNFLEPTSGNRSSTTSDYGLHYATNRPEDLEVGPDGEVYIALTNNSGVRDAHGSVRKLVEEENDPNAMRFVWTDYAPGGPESAGGHGFSSPDNLHFDSQENLWVVTDISTGSLNNPNNPEYDYHDNNAAFMVPTKGPNAGVAYRFANMPIQAEGTGPYFTPDESTLFINVQHPGEQAGTPEGPNNRAVFGQPETYPSYWPRGNKTAERNPSEPLPSTVAITRVRPGSSGGTPVIPPPPGAGAGGGGTSVDTTRPRLSLLSPRRQSLKRFRTKGMRFRIQVDEPVRLRVSAYGRLTSPRRRKAGASARGALRRFDRRTYNVEQAGTITVTLRPRAALRLLLRREEDMPGLLAVRAVDRAGNRATRTKVLLFK